MKPCTRDSVGVVLVTHNGWNLTKACLEGFLESGAGQCHVVVVDNVSQDGTPALLRELFPWVEVIALPENVGFGRANNVGVAACAPCGIVVLLNNDTLPSGKFWTQLIEGFLNAQRMELGEIIYAPRILNRDGTEQPSHFRDIGLVEFWSNAFRTEFAASRVLQGSVKSIPNSTLGECDWTSAVCWCMARSTWEKVGGFDERLFMYYEDVDFAWRARAHGIQFVQDSQVTLVHLGGGSAKSSLARSLQHDNSQQVVFQKRWGRKGYWVSKSFRLLRSLLRVIPFALLGIFWPRYRENRDLHVGLLHNLLN